jgi:hypothetical protein
LFCLRCWHWNPRWASSPSETSHEQRISGKGADCAVGHHRPLVLSAEEPIAKVPALPGLGGLSSSSFSLLAKCLSVFEHEVYVHMRDHPADLLLSSPKGMSSTMSNTCSTVARTFRKFSRRQISLPLPLPSSYPSRLPSTSCCCHAAQQSSPLAGGSCLLPTCTWVNKLVSHGGIVEVKSACTSCLAQLPGDGVQLLECHILP